MTKGPSTPTRVTADVATCAAAVATRENRSFAEQVNYWARIGMQVERSSTLANRRVLAVADADGQFAELDGAERVAAHALIDARIAGRAATERFGATARSTGQITVSLDNDGNLIEIAADGTRRAL